MVNVGDFDNDNCVIYTHTHIEVCLSAEVVLCIHCLLCKWYNKNPQNSFVHSILIFDYKNKSYTKFYIIYLHKNSLTINISVFGSLKSKPFFIAIDANSEALELTC